MRKKLNSCISRGTRFILLFIAVCFGSVAASATDFGEMQLDTEYQFPAFQTSTGTFTPDFSGEVLIWGFNNVAIFSDANYENEVAVTFKNYDHSGEGTFNVVAGTTYYIKASFPMDAFTFKMMNNSEVPLTLRYTIPAENQVLDLSQDSYVVFVFNQAVKAAEARIGYINPQNGAWTYGPVQFTAQGDQINVNFEQALTNLLTNGIVKPGDEIRVRLRNVATSETDKAWDQLDAQGFAYFSFKAGSIPVKYTGVDNISEFLSYWPAGDPAGIVTLNFDGPVSSAEAAIVYGSLENGENGVEHYYGLIPVTADGNSLTINLTGVRRTPSDMITNGTLFSKMELRVFNIRDGHGNPVSTPGAGTVGSVAFEYPYKEIPRADIYSEFTPENGGSLEGVSTITAWITGLNSMSFDGFKFSYAGSSVVVPLTDATKQNVSADGNEAEFVFAVPADVVGKKDIVVTLDNMTTFDGYDHERDIYVVYDGFTLTYASPADGTSMASLAEDAEITIRTNYTDKYPEMYIVYEIVDLNPTDPNEAVVKSAWLNRQDNGSYTAVNPFAVKLLDGHKYQVIFTAYETEMAKNYHEAPIGEASIYWYGTTPEFRYSPLEFVSVTPEEGTLLNNEDDTFTVVYNGLVRLDTEKTFINYGQGITYPFRSITPVQPIEYEGENYADTWVLQLPENYLANLGASLYLSVVAYDQDGLILRGNEGLEDSSYQCLIYDVASAYADFDVYADPETTLYENTVSSLSKLIVFNENGIGRDYNIAARRAVVYDMYRDVVAAVADVEPYIPEEEQDNYNYLVTECIVTLNQEITENGTYIVYFPTGYFVIGEEMNTRKSLEKMAEFEVSGQLSATTTPAEGDVENLSTIKVKFTKGLMPTEMAGNPTITKTGGEPVEITDIEIPENDEDPWIDNITLNLPATVTEPGEYTVVIPAQYFYVQGSFAYTDEFKFVYNVTGQPVKLPVTVDPAEGTVTTLGPSIKVTFDDELEIGLGTGIATMTIDNNEPFNLPDAELDWDVWNMAIQPLGVTYTDYGTYTITFPAGYFTLGSDGSRESQEMKLTYTITGTSAITSIAADANGLYVVYNVQGMKVLETADAQQLSTLAPGFYVINGAKYIIK